MEAEYSHGTMRAKIKLLILLAAFGSLYFIYRFVWLAGLPDVNSNSLSEQDMKNYINIVSNAGIYLSSVLMVVFLYMGYLCYAFGNRIKENMQYPPPGSEMPFTFRIQRGKKALNKSRAYYACSATVVLYGTVRLGISIYTASLLRGAANAF